jgi:hypothetical protein
MSYANMMATVAVFIALGGTSYAALRITGSQVADGTLTGRDVKNSSLTGADVKDGSLLLKDFKKGQLTAGAPGPQGAPGADGAVGAPGLKGDSGLKGDKGDTGDAGSALGYALIKPGVAPAVGTLDVVDETRSKNVTDANVFHPQTGVYCFKNLPFTPKSVTATMQYESTSGGPGNTDIPYVRTDDGSNVCFSAWQAYVVTLHNGTTSNLGFLVVFN